jgi:glycerate dehydrogenase
MNIVVLDGYTLNPGDLSWEALNNLGNLTVYDRTDLSNVIKRSKNAEIVLTNKTILSKEIIMSLDKLKYIGVLATGYNVVDIKAASEKGIVVTNVPAYSTNSVVQHTFALLLELMNKVALHNVSVKTGEWCRSSDFSYAKAPLIELTELTMGIIGFGKIGRGVAKVANGFGMKVIVNNRSKQIDLPVYVESVNLEEVFLRSDIISLHLPLTDENAGFVNERLLNLMKPNAYLLNTSRGGLINENDLAEALNSGKIAGAGLDVLSSEPPQEDNPLLTAANTVITPHIAWATIAARKRLMQIAVRNIKAFLEGKTENSVNNA